MVAIHLFKLGLNLPLVAWKPEGLEQPGHLNFVDEPTFVLIKLGERVYKLVHLGLGDEFSMLYLSGDVARWLLLRHNYVYFQKEINFI